MVTDFGKFCRKLRIDNDELLKDMASKLKVTPSYLSAVEKGKRTIPSDWEQKIAGLYQLDSNHLKELFTITTLNELTYKEKKALEEALSVLWLEDSSDYINGLWGVIKAILGDDIVSSDGFVLKDWMDIMKAIDNTQLV
jgi:transcriptional regulator with XRE-family HTH domain